MNDKIKLLAEQADAYAHLTGEGMIYQKTWDRYTEKFAELIVRECADVVKYYHSRNESVTPGQILQHFGVEE